jgi:hypothetical protein
MAYGPSGIKGRNGVWVEYWKNSYLCGFGTYVNNVKHGPWVEFLPGSKTPAHGAYRNGRRYGQWHVVSVSEGMSTRDFQEAIRGMTSQLP